MALLDWGNSDLFSVLRDKFNAVRAAVSLFAGGTLNQVFKKTSSTDFTGGWVNSGYDTVSTSSNTIGYGSLIFAIPAGFSVAIGNRIRFTDQASALNYVEGNVTAYSSGNVTIDSDNTGGTGIIAVWNVNLGGIPTNPQTSSLSPVATFTGGTTSSSTCVVTFVKLNGLMTCWINLSFSGGSGNFTQVDIPMAGHLPKVTSNIFGWATMNNDSSNDFIVQTTATGIKINRADGAVFPIATAVIRGSIIYPS